ncbi:MAG TPA: 30S ribosomal protein S17 [Pyrinomonadaceae bacterium]|jgi:small subunit ribosomal protein S17|nr:30S ribosomal protein S17 [Pyrinomonadaceae bacterium]
MFRRKKKDEPTEQPASAEAPETAEAATSEPVTTEASAPVETEVAAEASAASSEPTATADSTEAGVETTSASTKTGRGNRVQKVGIVSSDKMQKTVIVRVDRQVLHTKYRRYVRRTSTFMAHDDLGATTGDRVRIVETRPLSAKKRWRVVEIVQKAAK